MAYTPEEIKQTVDRVLKVTYINKQILFLEEVVSTDVRAAQA